MYKFKVEKLISILSRCVAMVPPPQNVFFKAEKNVNIPTKDLYVFLLSGTRIFWASTTNSSDCHGCLTMFPLMKINQFVTIQASQGGLESVLRLHRSISMPRIPAVISAREKLVLWFANLSPAFVLLTSRQVTAFVCMPSTTYVLL